MKFFNTKNKTFFWKISLLGLLFVLPGAPAQATEWTGNIFISNLSAQATNQPATFTVKGSGPNDASMVFGFVIGVTNPAIDVDKDGIIDDNSEELRSWDAVEDSGVTTQDGVAYLTPTDSALCPGGLCIEISAKPEFNKAQSTWAHITPVVTEKTQIRPFVVKGFKPGVTYYYRFVGQEAFSTDEHYFPTGEPLSFTVSGTAAPKFSIEIPKDKITKSSAELIVHMPEKNNLLVTLYKGNDSVSPTYARKAENAATDPAFGGYFHRLTAGAEVELDPGTQYKVVATFLTGDDKAEAFFTTAADAVNVSEDPEPEPDPSLAETGKYKLLAPLPGFERVFDIEKGITSYLNVLFRLLIGIAGLLAVIMIVIGGMQYMSTDAVSGKEEGKERVTQAIFGLIIALGAWLLLNTINPEILSLRFDLKEQTVQQGSELGGSWGEDTGPDTTITGGANWPPAGTKPTEAEARKLLSDGGVSVTSSKGTTCIKVGQQGCTSVAGLPYNTINKLIVIKVACKCEVTITGGTEYWLHKTHGINKPVVDLRINKLLNKYLVGKEDYPNDCKEYTINKEGVHGIAVAETNTGSASCSWKPVPHWHLKRIN